MRFSLAVDSTPLNQQEQRRHHRCCLIIRIFYVIMYLTTMMIFNNVANNRRLFARAFTPQRHLSSNTRVMNNIHHQPFNKQQHPFLLLRTFPTSIPTAASPISTSTLLPSVLTSHETVPPGVSTVKRRSSTRRSSRRKRAKMRRPFPLFSSSLPSGLKILNPRSQSPLSSGPSRMPSDPIP